MDFIIKSSELCSKPRLEPSFICSSLVFVDRRKLPAATDNAFHRNGNYFRKSKTNEKRSHAVKISAAFYYFGYVNTSICPKEYND